MDHKPTVMFLLLSAALFAFALAAPLEAPLQHDLDQYVVNIRRASNLQLDVNIDIEVRPANQLYSNTVCSAVTLHPKPNATDVRVNAAKWLNNETLLLAKYDEFEGGDRNVTFLTINLQNCSLSSLDRYDAIVTSRPGFNTKVITEFASSMVKDEFGFDWPENGTGVQQAASENQLLVYFHDDEGTLKIRLYNSSSNYKELMSMPNSRDVHVKSNNLAICWLRRPSSDKRVNCSIYNENGDLQSTTDVDFSIVIVLARVNYVETRYWQSLVVEGKTIECQRTKLCRSDYIAFTPLQTEDSYLKLEREFEARIPRQ